MKARASAKRGTRTATSSVATKRATRPSPAGGKYSAIRRDLQKQRQVILDEAGEGLTKREGPEAFPDVSDQASAEVDQNFSMRIKEREQKLLKKIDEALDRMESVVSGPGGRSATLLDTLGVLRMNANRPGPAEEAFAMAEKLCREATVASKEGLKEEAPCPAEVLKEIEDHRKELRRRFP